jgi:hypothetical protein
MCNRECHLSFAVSVTQERPVTPGLSLLSDALYGC